MYVYIYIIKKKKKKKEKERGKMFKSKNTNINIYENYANKLKNRYTSYDYSDFKNANKIYKKLEKELSNVRALHNDIRGVRFAEVAQLQTTEK